MKLLRGRSINAMVTACLYHVCKELKIPRTFQEILKESYDNATNIKKCYRILLKELHLKDPITDPILLIPKYATELGLNSKIEKRTIKVLESYMKMQNYSGKDPKGLCAGALYLVCKLSKKKMSQQKIAEVVGVTEVTLRSRYKDFSKKLNIKIESN